jgi:diadenylate cyclase
MWYFLTEHWRDGVEILILAALAYHGYLFFRATRGARILTGLLILLLGLALISLLLELSVISSLLQRFSVFLAVALVVIFQPELRRVLAELGSSSLFSFNRPDPEALDVLMEAMQQLSSRRCGALFALKRGIDLKPFAESGVELDSVISIELITTIFIPKPPSTMGASSSTRGASPLLAVCFRSARRTSRTVPSAFVTALVWVSRRRQTPSRLSCRRKAARFRSAIRGGWSTTWSRTHCVGASTKS